MEKNERPFVINVVRTYGNQSVVNVKLSACVITVMRSKYGASTTISPAKPTDYCVYHKT